MVNAIAFLFAAVLLGMLIALVGLIIVSWDEARTRLEERRRWDAYFEKQKAKELKRRKAEQEVKWYTVGEGMEKSEGR